MSPALLEARDVAVHFPVGERRMFGGHEGVLRAVDGVSIALERGKSLGLVGESGSGKSTFARTLLGLARPTSGTVLFDERELGALVGADLRNFRRRVAMVFQDPNGSLDPRLTVAALVREPLDVHGVGNPRERLARTIALVEAVGLSVQHLARYPHEFSGGQRQRIAIARALALEPELLILDEPVSALDVSIQAQVLNLLLDLRERFGLTFLLVAHNLAVVRSLCDEVAVMYLGRIVERGPTQRVLASPRHPYTQALVAAVPVPDPHARRSRFPQRGEPPSPIAPPPGCAFHPRCPDARRVGEKCTKEAPRLQPLSDEPKRAAACHLYTFEPTAQRRVPGDLSGR